MRISTTTLLAPIGAGSLDPAGSVRGFFVRGGQMQSTRRQAIMAAWNAGRIDLHVARDLLDAYENRIRAKRAPIRPNRIMSVVRFLRRSQ
jgi:hypothetical protein